MSLIYNVHDKIVKIHWMLELENLATSPHFHKALSTTNPTFSFLIGQVYRFIVSVLVAKESLCQAFTKHIILPVQFIKPEYSFVQSHVYKTFFFWGLRACPSILTRVRIAVWCLLTWQTSAKLDNKLETYTHFCNTLQFCMPELELVLRGRVQGILRRT